MGLTSPEGDDRDKIDWGEDVGSRGVTKKVTRHRQMDLFVNVVHAQLVFKISGKMHSCKTEAINLLIS